MLPCTMDRREAMKIAAIRACTVVLLLALAGCATGPFISKSTMGNLEINMTGAEPEDAPDPDTAMVYIDDMCVGNVSRRLPVLHVRRGEHTVRVELKGYKPWSQKIHILGDPNHQVLNVELERERTPAK